MKKLVFFSIFLALVLIILGTHTRLTQAGLGCLNWPDCYAANLVERPEAQLEASSATLYERSITDKPGTVIIHRYLAASLAFFIIIIFIASLLKKQKVAQAPLKLPVTLFLLVCLQGALGMWSVAPNLLPILVLAHLLGGFAVLSCLFLLYLRLTPYRIPGGDLGIRKYAKFALLGIVILVWQITLGGWSSANYASLACTELPICDGNWFGNLDIAGAFSLPVASNGEFGVHDYQERVTMHVMHRIGAIVTFIYLCWLAIVVYKQSSSALMRRLATIMTLVLGAQVLLGVSNVVFSLPIAVAVLHNAVAACLLLVMILLTYTMFRKY